MAGELNETPRADRIHIAIFGRTNAGKSSTINFLTGAPTALVSEVPGTTTDPVYKSMELHPIGPVVLIDTAGTEDTTRLGEARAEKTREVARKTDIAIFLMADDETEDDPELARLAAQFENRHVPIIRVRNQHGSTSDAGSEAGVVNINATTGAGREELLDAIRQSAAQMEDVPLTTGLVKTGDLVILVMPQDVQAPKGRLILPQVQTIRDLLDADCKVLCVKTADVPDILSELTREPALVITDSQIFDHVARNIPKSIPLTSFSILMSKKRGDIRAFVDGANAIASLKTGSKVLIAESCTHHALKGDIAREKIPALLEKDVGGPLDISVCSGPAFPDDLPSYDLIIQCGGCMINRANMMSRIEAAKEAGVPIANFGTALAYMNGILSRIVFD